MRLRADVELEWSGEEAVLHDRLLSRTLRLGRAAAEVVRRLPELREPFPEELRMLLCLNLVEGSGSDVIDRARRLSRGQIRLGRVILSEARFGCIGSGDCCQSYHFGPLTEQDLLRLAKLPIAETFGVDKYTHERDFAGQKLRFLVADNNRCVFLLDDCRCGIHAHFGVEAKPNLCRFYPYEQYATLDGVQVYDKAQCSEFSTTARSGPMLSDELDQLSRLLDGSPRLHHPVVLLDPETPVDFGYVQPLLRRTVGELAKPPAGAPEMLRAWYRRTRDLKNALMSCALTPEAPSQVVKELAERAADLSPGGDLRVGAAALQVVAQELAHLLMLPISVEHLQQMELYSGRQAKELIPVLHLVQEVAAHIAYDQPLSDYARDVAAVSVDDEDAFDVLRLSLRHQLFGHDALVDDRVGPGQLRLAMVQLLALWGARIRAAMAGRKKIVAADLDRGHMLATRSTSWASVQRTFIENEDATTPVLEALPELARF
jgi:Fe-S-cluster containining protein